MSKGWRRGEGREERGEGERTEDNERGEGEERKGYPMPPVASTITELWMEEYWITTLPPPPPPASEK